jgi:alpha-L-rhamnosidase
MISAYDLRCEYATNPLGIGSIAPRLSWKLSHPERNQQQTAYQIIAAHNAEALREGGEDLVWDSGKVPSSNSVAVEYGGPPLASRERVYWRVRCWDAQDRPGPWSEIAWFEVALLNPEDWKADWIGYPGGWPGRALYFRRQFDVSKPIDRARLYVTGLGYHELFINGQRLGDAVLDPAYTDISARVMYRVFDIGPQLVTGSNVFAATVGNGWHGSPRLLAQIELYFADGTSTCIYTEDWGGWFVTCGPVLENSIYGGETYDAREEKPGWNLPMDGTPPQGPGGWTGAMHVPAPGGVLTPQMIEPIRITDELRPRSITTPKPGVYVVDFGQNIAGWVQLRVNGERGTRVVLKFAELLYPDGTVNQENLRVISPTDTYILKGGEEEVWEPRFTYHGFRYVQVEGYPGELTADSITGKVVRSSVEEAGRFTCSNELLNRIQTMVWWTERNNQHGIPTDCPQRNERMGWLNDMVARAEEAFFNFKMPLFMSKWIGDIYDAQDPVSGGVPLTAPRAWMAGRVPTEPVSVSYLETSWLLYAHYGDRRTLETYYNGYQKWLQRLSDQAKDYIVDTAWVADWAPPIDHVIPGTLLSGAPAALMGTGFYYYGARLLARIAGILGKTEDQKHYETLAAEIGEAFNRHFWDEEAGGYGTNNQSCNCFALWLGLVPEDRKARVLENLVRDIVERGYHLTTGNVCTKYLLEALSANNRTDVALKIATQTTYPSWGYMLENGATTLWERWELYTSHGMNSHNHPMMGSISSWFYKVLAGINITPQTAGFDYFDLHPHIVEGLDYVIAQHHTIRGMVESAWYREGERLILHVTIPVNCFADVTFPVTSRQTRILESGTCIWDGEQPQHLVAGVSFLRSGANEVRFRVGSGAYEFVVE